MKLGTQHYSFSPAVAQASLSGVRQIKLNGVSVGVYSDLCQLNSWYRSAVTLTVGLGLGKGLGFSRPLLLLNKPSSQTWSVYSLPHHCPFCPLPPNFLIWNIRESAALHATLEPFTMGNDCLTAVSTVQQSAQQKRSTPMAREYRIES